MKYFIGIVALAGLQAVPAYAADANDTRQATECRPAKDIIKFFSKFDKMKPEQRDTVDADIRAAFVIESGELPDRIYYRNKDQDYPFTMNSDGEVVDFASITHKSRDGELCVDDPARAGLKREGAGLRFNVDFDVKFKNATGNHSLEDLRDGARDGKSFYKKIVPAPLRLMIPKMTHVSVTYKDDATKPDINAMRAGERITGLDVEKFGATYVVSLDRLEDLGADSLAIAGGAYMLEPSPSIKKMKKLGFFEDDEDEQK